MNDNDNDFDKRFGEFDKNFARSQKTAIGFAIFSIISTIIFGGVIIWAIVKLVQHFTA